MIGFTHDDDWGDIGASIRKNKWFRNHSYII